MLSYCDASCAALVLDFSLAAQLGNESNSDQPRILTNLCTLRVLRFRIVAMGPKSAGTASQSKVGVAFSWPTSSGFSELPSGP